MPKPWTLNPFCLHHLPYHVPGFWMQCSWHVPWEKHAGQWLWLAVRLGRPCTRQNPEPRSPVIRNWRSIESRARMPPRGATWRQWSRWSLRWRQTQSILGGWCVLAVPRMLPVCLRGVCVCMCVCVYVYVYYNGLCGLCGWLCVIRAMLRACMKLCLHLWHSMYALDAARAKDSFGTVLHLVRCNWLCYWCYWYCNCTTFTTL